MKKLIDKFYSFSALKRLIILVVVTIVISASIVLYSGYNLSCAIRNIQTPSRFEKKLTLYELAEINKESNVLIKKDVEIALKEFDRFDIYYKKYFNIADSKIKESSINETQINKIISSINIVSTLKLQDSLIFANKFTDIFSPIWHNFSATRRKIEFLSAFAKFMKTRNSNFDVSSIISIIEVNSRIAESVAPYLLGKMISIGIEKVNLKLIYSLLKKDSITSVEATNILNILTDSYSCQMSFRQTLENEYVFFKQGRAYFYKKAPLACWALDTIFGDPDIRYKEMISNKLSSEEWLKKMNSEKHILLLLFIPNFRLAQEIYSQNMAYQSIICSKIADIAGITQTFIDPYTKAKVLSATNETGKQFYYCAGPNKIDDKGKGDDIVIENLMKKKNRSKKKK